MRGKRLMQMARMQSKTQTRLVSLSAQLLLLLPLPRQRSTRSRPQRRVLVKRRHQRQVQQSRSLPERHSRTIKRKVLRLSPHPSPPLRLRLPPPLHPLPERHPSPLQTRLHPRQSLPSSLHLWSLLRLNPHPSPSPSPSPIQYQRENLLRIPSRLHLSLSPSRLHPSRDLSHSPSLSLNRKAIPYKRSLRTCPSSKTSLSSPESDR